MALQRSLAIRSPSSLSVPTLPRSVRAVGVTTDHGPPADAVNAVFTLKRHARVRNSRNEGSSAHKSFSQNAGSKQARYRGGASGQDQGAAIELRTGGFGESSNTYVEGVHVQTTKATQIEDGEPDAYVLPGRQHVVRPAHFRASGVAC